MKKDALRKNFWREIRNSKGRFLSIFCIVLLGTAFFAGIRATEPDMRYTGDAYTDKFHLMDLQVVSTLGLTGEDVEALSEVNGVQTVEPGYSADVLCVNHEGQDVLHVMSMLPTMNQIDLAEGRLPETAGECLVDADFLKNSDYKLGDQIQLLSGTDAKITDTFKGDTFTIVGSGYSPCYLSFYRGSASIGTGSVKGFAYVLAENFVTEAYTEIYVQVAGAQELTAFTEAYDTKVQDASDRIEKIKDTRQTARYQEIVGEATQKLEDAKAELETAKTEAAGKLEAAQEELEEGKAQLEAARQQLISGKNQLQTAKQQLASKEKELAEGQTALQEQQQTLDQNREKLQQAQASLSAGLAQLDANLTQLQETYDQLAGSGGADPETLNQLQAQIMALQAQKEALLAQQNALQDQSAQLDAGQQKLNAALEEWKAGQAQIASAKETLAAREAQLSQGEREIASNEQKLQEGQISYETAKAEAEAKIADGEQQIQEAEDEVSKIENAKWYINDRSVLTEYSGYGENADRMRAIGEVFPVLFFLVAALISLTTMTRMVEEQRTEIGTLKALGYSRKSISVKYLGYALLATLGGGVLGVLIGEKLLPQIIIRAYQMMYPHVTTVRTPYDVKYTVAAVVIAAVCTVGAAWFACGRELRGTAAELMRPPAPKSGKRVLLERIPFFWKHLSFIWKATVRNLFRYKKRFFMTVSGIGGCMGLLLVGFGLEDSISNIARLQYREIQRYDANLILNPTASAAEQEKTVETVETDEKVGAAKRVLMEQVKVSGHGKTLDVYLDIPESSEDYGEFVTLRSRIGEENYSLEKDRVVLTEKAASLLGVQVGDTIVIRDEVRGEIQTKISAVCENYMGHYLYMSPDTYQKLFEREPKYNAVCFRMKKGQEDQLEAVGEKILGTDGAFSVKYVAEIQDQVDAMLTSLDSVMGVIVLFAGMLAFVVLYNLNNINITERRRELATLKVLGFYDLEVAEYVYRENILLTIFGAAGGCILGKLLHRFVIETVEIDTVMFGRNIDFSSFVIGILLTFGFSCFVNWIMFYKLRKIDMVESLKSVE